MRREGQKLLNEYAATSRAWAIAKYWRRAFPHTAWREHVLVRLVHLGENVEINTGTILIEKHALRPQCFQLRDYAYPNAWMLVTHDLTPAELEKELSIAGWTFFYMASAIRTTSFGFNRAKMIHAALKRIIANVKQQRCNSLEIDDVTTHSFLGMPYVNVSAHPRHIQKGMVFSSP